MTDKPPQAGIPESWSPETLLVHGGTLRSPFGETSEALFLTQSLRLRQRRAGRGALQGRGPGLHLFALLQPDRRPCSRSACGCSRAPRPRAPPPPAWRPSPRRCCASSRPATTSSRRAPCSARASTWRRSCVRASASPARWSTAATRGAWQRAVEPNTKAFFFETPANPTLDLVDIAAVSRDRARRRRARDRRQRVRHAAAAEAAASSAPTSSSIPPPSTSTARAAASAASCCARRSSSRTTCTPSCARPARRSARSMPG